MYLIRAEIAHFQLRFRTSYVELRELVAIFDRNSKSMYFYATRDLFIGRNASISNECHSCSLALQHPVRNLSFIIISSDWTRRGAVGE